MTDTPHGRGGAPVDGEHSSFDALADRDAGLLGASTAAQIDAHVATCLACTQARDQVRAVSWALANAADEPLPMPGDVAIRIDAALVREAQQREESEVASLPAAVRVRQPRVSWTRRLLAGATIAAAVVGGGYVLMANLDGSSSGGVVAGPNPTGITADPNPYASSAGAPSATITARTAAPDQKIAEQVRQVAADADETDFTDTTPTQPRGTKHTDVGPEDEPTFSIQQFPVCAAAVQTAVRATGAAVGDLVGTAMTTFHGQPAVLVVFDVAGKRAMNGGPFDAYIVSTSCISSSTAAPPTVEVLDHILVQS